MQRRNSPAILLLYAITISVCLQVALNWPAVQIMSLNLMESWSDEAVQADAGIAVVTLIAPLHQGKEVVVLLNGSPCGTLANGRLQLAVRDGDIIELDGYSRDTVTVTVMSTDQQVILPVPGQVGSVKNSRTVLARVLLRK